ncbi:MAG: nodulation protein NodZ, partial [Gaiellaceae bacterium]
DHEQGMFGCSVSHCEAVRLARSNGWKSVVIFEDDIKIAADLDEHAAAVLADLSQREWGLFQFGAMFQQPELLEFVTPRLFRFFRGHAAHACALHERTYDWLLETYICELDRGNWDAPAHYPFDEFINNHLSTHFDAYGSVKLLISQHAGHSDTWDGAVDYADVIEETYETIGELAAESEPREPAAPARGLGARSVGRVRQMLGRDRSKAEQIKPGTVRQLTAPPVGARESASILERYDGILRIRINHSYAGFFAYVTFALNQLRYAEEHNLFPVVHFGEHSEDGPNAFYDAPYGESIWDYYFEPVAGMTYAELRRRLDDPSDPLSESGVISLPTDELWHLHVYYADSLYNYPYGYYREVPNEELDEWYEDQRALARELIAKYVRLKPHVVAKVDEFWREQLKGFDVLGIHMRGSDKGAADARPEHGRIVMPEEYFPYCDRYLSDHPAAKIFVATEQSQFVDVVRSRYPDRVVTREVIRTSGFGDGSNPFQKSGGGYQKGEEVLIDCLLLARSSFLLRCTSAVGEYAMYFNEDLECINLNHG